MNWYDWLLSPYMFLGIMGLMVVIAGVVIVLLKFRPTHHVMYLSEADRLGKKLGITDETSPIFVRTKENKRFIRNANAYTIRGRRSETIYLAKRGTAYTFKPSDGPKHEEKIGTLYDGLVACWGLDKVKAIKQDLKDLVMKSEIFLTVELEKGITPKDMPIVSETDITNDANLRMRDLISQGIKNSQRRTEWIQIFLAMGSGGMVVFLLYALGIVK